MSAPLNREPWQQACGADSNDQSGRVPLTTLGAPAETHNTYYMNYIGEPPGPTPSWVCSREAGHDGPHASEWHNGRRAMWFDEPLTIDFTIP